MNIIKSHYINKINNNFLNLIDEKLLNNDSDLKKALSLWGENLHKRDEIKLDSFKKGFEYEDKIDTHIEKVLKEFNLEINFQNYLEIGCGAGSDLRYIIKNFNFNNFYAVDLGKNIYELSLIKNFKNIFFCRCDCKNLPFENNSFDFIYSYGVFHHTKNYNQSIIEAKRVLKPNGILIFYNYKKHRNYFKRFGTWIERILLNMFKNLSFNQTKFICYLISPIILLIFSYPALILKLMGAKSIYKSFPLWWGRTPSNIIGDLTDRLYAPINRRFTKKEMFMFLKKNNFKKIEIKDVRDGLFCKVTK